MIFLGRNVINIDVTYVYIHFQFIKIASMKFIIFMCYIIHPAYIRESEIWQRCMSNTANFLAIN